MSAVAVVTGMREPTLEEFLALPIFDTPNDAFRAGIRAPDAFRIAGWTHAQHIEQVRRMSAPPPRATVVDAVSAEVRRAELTEAARIANRPQSIERVGDVVTIVEEVCGIRFTMTIDSTDAYRAPDRRWIGSYKGLVLGRLRVLAEHSCGAANTGHWEHRDFDRGDQ